MIFFRLGIRDVGIESCGLFASGRVVGARFTVFGGFGIDAVFLLRVFAGELGGGGGGYGTDGGVGEEDGFAGDCGACEAGEMREAEEVGG